MSAYTNLLNWYIRVSKDENHDDLNSYLSEEGKFVTIVRRINGMRAVLRVRATPENSFDAWVSVYDYGIAPTGGWILTLNAAGTSVDEVLLDLESKWNQIDSEVWK